MKGRFEADLKEWGWDGSEDEEGRREVLLHMVREPRGLGVLDE